MDASAADDFAGSGVGGGFSFGFDVEDATSKPKRAAATEVTVSAPPKRDWKELIGSVSNGSRHTHLVTLLHTRLMFIYSAIILSLSVELDIKPEKKKKAAPKAKETAKPIARPADGGGFMRTNTDVEVRNSFFWCRFNRPYSSTTMHPNHLLQMQEDWLKRRTDATFDFKRSALIIRLFVIGIRGRPFAPSPGKAKRPNDARRR
jgi:hypothetical protein